MIYISGNRTNTCADLRDRFNELCGKALCGMPDLETISGKALVDLPMQVEDILAKHSDAAEHLKNCADGDIFLKVVCSRKSNGDLIISWAPAKPSRQLEVAMSQVASLHGFDFNRIELKGSGRLIEAVHQSEAAPSPATHLLRAMLLLQRVLESTLGSIASTKLLLEATLTGQGEVKIIDHEKEAIISFEEWISFCETTYPGAISLARHLLNSGNDTTSLQRRFASCGFEMSAHQIAHLRVQLSRIQEFNGAWWRTRPRIQLPDPSSSVKKISDDRYMVKNKGSAPRRSPLAARPDCGTNIAGPGELSAKISEKIQSECPNWHFTAGDFLEFAALEDRQRIVRALVRMKSNGDIYSETKGIYTRQKRFWQQEPAIEALMRDRGEAYCISYWKALRRIGVPKDFPHTDYFTSGSTRKITFADQTVKFSIEPFPGLCEKASLLPQHKQAVLITLTCILGAKRRGAGTEVILIDLMEKHPDIFETAQILSRHLI